jgi:hypothetical protein
MRDLANNLAIRTAIASVTVSDNTPLVGVVIDSLGFEGVVYAIGIGTLADADATFVPLIEESDSSGSGFTAVADADLIGTEAGAGFTFADDGETRKLGYVGNKRYTRLTITPSGNAGSASLAALAILGHAHQRPVA